MLNPFRARAARALGATLILTTQACYTFVPLVGPQPVVGQQALVFLTPEGTTELARYLGPNVAAAEGLVASVTEDGSIMMAVQYVEQTNQLRQPWTGEGVVAIPAMYRREVRQRSFQKRRSIVAGTLLSLGLMSLAVIALRGGKSGNGGVEVPPPPP